MVEMQVFGKLSVPHISIYNVGHCDGHPAKPCDVNLGVTLHLHSLIVNDGHKKYCLLSRKGVEKI